MVVVTPKPSDLIISTTAAVRPQGNATPANPCRGVGRRDGVGGTYLCYARHRDGHTLLGVNLGALDGQGHRIQAHSFNIG